MAAVEIVRQVPVAGKTAVMALAPVMVAAKQAVTTMAVAVAGVRPVVVTVVAAAITPATAVPRADVFGLEAGFLQLKPGLFQHVEICPTALCLCAEVSSPMPSPSDSFNQLHQVTTEVP